MERRRGYLENQFPLSVCCRHGDFLAQPVRVFLHFDNHEDAAQIASSDVMSSGDLSSFPIFPILIMILSVFWKKNV